MEFRLCSTALAEAWPLASIPRDTGVDRLRDRFGVMFGRSLHAALNGARPLEPAHVVMANTGVGFANSAQISWAVHVAGMAATAQGLPSESAFIISAFAAGDAPFSSVPNVLRALGAYSVIERAQARDLAAWLLQVDQLTLRKEAHDLHGAEWVASIVSVVSTVASALESAETHGADLCAWGA